MQPLVMLTVPPEGISLETWPNLPKEGRTFSGMRQQLPKQVHIPTLEWWGSGEVLIRFEHLFDKHDKVGDLSSPVSFDLTKDFFNGFQIDTAQEMLLAGDRSKDDEVLIFTQADFAQ